MFLYNDSNGVNSTVLWVIGSQGQNNTSVELSYEQILATMLIYIYRIDLYSEVYCSETLHQFKRNFKVNSWNM